MKVDLLVVLSLIGITRQKTASDKNAKKLFWKEEKQQTAVRLQRVLIWKYYWLNHVYIYAINVTHIF